MAQKVFKRYELKYLVTDEQRMLLETELKKYMVLDKHCRETGYYMIYNIYYDTDNDEIIRRSLEKPYYKEKLRLRSYKVPVADSDLIFLELKKKIGGIVSKRRAIMAYGEAENYLKTGIIHSKDITATDKQVLMEISCFLSRHKVVPKVYLSYERTAFYGKDNDEFRVTFDKNILTRREKADMKSGDFGNELMDVGQQLMEIKVDGSIPVWLCEKLSQLKIYTTSFSKYGTEYKRYARELSRAEKNKVTAVLAKTLMSECTTAL